MMNDFKELETTSDLREALSSINHELNNPLSIISGNAQFLLELSQEEEELDKQFVSSARDIQEASQRMAESLKRLMRLRNALRSDQEDGAR